MRVVTSMTAVHEKVHEKTPEQKHKRKIWREMPAMVDHEIESDDCQESDQNISGARVRRIVAIVSHVYFCSKLELCIQTK